MSDQTRHGMVNRRDEVIWDAEPPFYAVVLPQGYNDVNAQMLLAFFGEVLGYNTRLVRVGSRVHGHRFTNVVLIDVVPDDENLWWGHFFACVWPRTEVV